MAQLQKITNNPLNVRYVEKNHWLGQIGSHKGFCQFKGQFWGVRAAILCVIAYMRRGHRTINSIINHYAPPCENNTGAYVHFCCHFVKEKPDVVLKDWVRFMYLILAMWQMESGENGDAYTVARAMGWLSPELKEVGISMPDFITAEEQLKDMNVI